MISKKKWIAEAAEVFKSRGSKMPEMRARALYKQQSDGILPKYWLRKKRNTPFLVVARHMTINPYEG